MSGTDTRLRAITSKRAAPRPSSRTTKLAVAAILFAAVYALRIASSDPRDGIALLYALPVAILAVQFGFAGGIAAATLGILLTILDGSSSNELPAAGYATRFLVLAGTGGIVGWFVDREKAMHAQQEEGREKMVHVFNLSADMLCTADRDGHLRDINPAWEGTLGFSEEELRARPFVDFVHPDDRERTIAEASQIFDGTGSVDFENRYLDKDGNVHWLQWSSRLGPEDLIYARATDVTERRRAEEVTRELLAALERSNEELKQFAYIASHDLSEPLRTISGFAQLLQKRYESAVDERGREYIERMVNGVERMQRMIADLLAFSRAGRAELERRRVDTEALVQEVVDSLEQAVVDRDTQIQVGALPDVEADRHQLEQLFQNLIANAIKFNDSEQPQVKVEGSRQNGACRFSVADNGIGIPPDKRERIFGAFQRLHSRDEYQGSGIGLAICEKIVERHGGRIEVSEGIGGAGSAFNFTIADLS